MDPISTPPEYSAFVAPTVYLEPVGPGRRFVNYLFDVVGVLLFFLVLVFFFALLGSTALTDLIEKPLMDRVVFLVLTIIYYLTLEATTGRTLGKLVTGTRVVLEDGGKPAFGTILKRTLWRCVPFDGLTFLGHGQGWHDTKSGTMVVRVTRR